MKSTSACFANYNLINLVFVDNDKNWSEGS